MNNFQIIEKVSSHFAKLMIAKIESLKLTWQKPWFSGKGVLPRNISGKNYAGTNVLSLLFLTEVMNYRTPIFLTFKQAKERGLRVKKGTSQFPVTLWKPFYAAIVDAEGLPKFLPVAEYNKLTLEQQRNYKIQFRLHYYLVLNLDQTDFEERYPEQWHRFLAEQELPTQPVGEDLPLLESVLDTQSWVCPIQQVVGNRAFYSPCEDRITLPKKEQFCDMPAFYATMLHEMAHSTGTDSRLHRNLADHSQYGREELVAEFSAALIGLGLGVSTQIRDENVAYLQGWLDNIAEKPEFIFTVLTDVQRVVRFFCEQLHTTIFTSAAIEDDAA